MPKKSSVTPSQHQQHVDKGSHAATIGRNQAGNQRGTPDAYSTHAGKGSGGTRPPKK